MVQERQWKELAVSESSGFCFWRPNLPCPFLEGLERQILALVEFYHSADLLAPDNVWGTDHGNICRKRGWRTSVLGKGQEQLFLQEIFDSQTSNY